MEILPLHSKINFLTTFLTGKCLTAFIFPFLSFACPLDCAECRMPVLAACAVAIPAFVLQSKPDVLYTILEIMSFYFFWEVRLWEVLTLTRVPAHLWAHHSTTSEDSRQGHSMLALSSREIHMPAELITLTATEIILAHQWPSEMNISLSNSQGDVNGIFINWWPVDCY